MLYNTAVVRYLEADHGSILYRIGSDAEFSQAYHTQEVRSQILQRLEERLADRGYLLAHTVRQQHRDAVQQTRFYQQG